MKTAIEYKVFVLLSGRKSPSTPFAMTSKVSRSSNQQQTKHSQTPAPNTRTKASKPSLSSEDQKIPVNNDTRTINSADQGDNVTGINQDERTKHSSLQAQINGNTNPSQMSFTVKCK